MPKLIALPTRERVKTDKDPFHELFFCSSPFLLVDGLHNEQLLTIYQSLSLTACSLSLGPFQKKFHASVDTAPRQNWMAGTNIVHSVNLYEK